MLYFEWGYISWLWWRLNMLDFWVLAKVDLRNDKIAQISMMWHLAARKAQQIHFLHREIGLNKEIDNHQFKVSVPLQSSPNTQIPPQKTMTIVWTPSLLKPVFNQRVSKDINSTSLYFNFYQEKCQIGFFPWEQGEEDWLKCIWKVAKMIYDRKSDTNFIEHIRNMYHGFDLSNDTFIFLLYSNIEIWNFQTFLCFNSLYIWRETCWISLLLERWISDEWNELKTARSLTQLHSTTIFSFWREILGLLYEHWTVLTCWKNSLKCQELPIFLISPTNDRHPTNNVLFQLQS